VTRTALPNRRHAERIRFEHGEPGREQTFFGTLGYPDLSGELPLEIFLAGGKPGSSLDAMSRDFAVVVSIALQSGVPLEDMRRAITRLDDGSAAGPGGKLLDLIGGTDA
jgi:hypothetical protein